MYEIRGGSEKDNFLTKELEEKDMVTLKKGIIDNWISLLNRDKILLNWNVYEDGTIFYYREETRREKLEEEFYRMREYVGEFNEAYGEMIVVHY